MATTRLLLADDHEIVRMGLRALIQQHRGWEVVAEARDGKEAVEKAKLLQPDIAILDIGMPVLNGLEATREIVTSVAQTKVLILTVYDSDGVIQRVLKAGARGYVLKSGGCSDLFRAIEALNQNNTFFTQQITQMVLDGYIQRDSNIANADPVGSQRLTFRQRQIVQSLAEGQSSKEIATALTISVKTVETHRANIMRRIGCHSVTQLVRYAIRNDIIQA
jgi:DNA-binding NarL/FixJ family response regulator